MPAPPAAIIVYERHSYLLSFVPFGAGQFQNGDRRKGWLFFGAESALAAVSVGAFATNLALYGLAPQRKCQTPPDMTGLSGTCPPKLVDHTQENTSRWLMRVQLVSGGLFFATAIWGIVDAVRHYQKDLLVAGASGDGTRRRSPNPRFRLTFTPQGLGAAWGF